MANRNNLVVAPKQDVDPELPSHVAGVHQGNAPTRLEKAAGGIDMYPDFALATPRRSTGINAEDRNPILKGSPVLTPP